MRVLDEGAPLGKFDLVITNPPYVRTQVLGADVSRQLAARFHLKGRIDLTHAFVAIIGSLLVPDGVLALLCSNRFLSTRAGVNTRQMLSYDYRVHEVYDLGDTKLFEAAVLPAVVIAGKGGRQIQADSVIKFTRVYETIEAGASSRTYASVLLALENDEDGRIAVGRKTFTIESGILVNDNPRDPWQLGQGRDAQWIADVMAGCWKTYGEIAKIRVGIKTTADSVFMRDEWDSLPESIHPETDLLLPLITHYDTRPWRVNTNPATKVLYPYDLTAPRRRLLSLADDYPRAMAYLKSHEERLRARRYVTEGGREWYEIWVPQRPSKWAEPKIVFPDISERPQFSIDKSGAVVNGDCYWISCAELPSMDIAYLMLAVANSSIGVRFYDTVCGNKLYSGKRRWITQYVEKLPLPDPTDDAARRAIELARKLCDSGLATGTRDEILSELDALITEAFFGSRRKKSRGNLICNFRFWMLPSNRWNSEKKSAPVVTTRDSTLNRSAVREP